MIVNSDEVLMFKLNINDKTIIMEDITEFIPYFNLLCFNNNQMCKTIWSKLIITDYYALDEYETFFNNNIKFHRDNFFQLVNDDKLLKDIKYLLYVNDNLSTIKNLINK